MDPREEQRRFPRLSTGGEYLVSLQMVGFGPVPARLQNLSACGCGLEVPITDMSAIELGARFYDILLIHEDLPCVPLQGTVVRILGKVPGKSTGYALVGVDFLPITPFLRNLIQAHVLACLA